MCYTEFPRGLRSAHLPARFPSSSIRLLAPCPSAHLATTLTPGYSPLPCHPCPELNVVPLPAAEFLQCLPLLTIKRQPPAGCLVLKRSQLTALGRIFVAVREWPFLLGSPFPVAFVSFPSSVVFHLSLWTHRPMCAPASLGQCLPFEHCL